MCMPKEALYIGIDVAKGTLEIAYHPKQRRWQEANTDLASLAIRLKQLEPTLIVLESSGGYEQALLKALQQEGLPVRLENAAHIFHYRKSKGRLVKTDHTDAQVIADYAAQEHYRLTPSETLSDAVEVLRERMLRYMQLTKMETMEKNHYQAPTKGVRTSESCRVVLTVLETEIKQLKQEIFKMIESDASLRQKAAWLESIPGIGKMTAATLLSFLPELGQANRKEIAALAGLAPYERTSGKYKGRAYIQCGRSSLRPFLYMCAMSARKCNPVVKQVYERLVAEGKPGKVALTACMHKLMRIANTLIKNQEYWKDPASA